VDLRGMTQEMNHKYVSAIAAFLILGVLLSATPLAYAQTLAFGPKLEVTTIPQDDQLLKKGIIILGINPIGGPTLGQWDLLSQHKLIVTYNGQTLTWNIGTAGPTIACNVLEKDKVNVIPDPKTGDGKQGDYENLMTKLTDVSDKFVCKPRWKSPAAGVYESVGVLDVYYVGPLTAAPVPNVTPAGTNGKQVGVWIADNILVVEAFFTVGRTVVFGSDMQDICVLGWPITGSTVNAATAPTYIITKPDGTQHYIWQNAMGNFVGCEELALAQRDVLGILLETGQDSVLPA
jgi:hypothetical protein